MTTKNYLGTVVSESLNDARFLNTLHVTGGWISNDDTPEEQWHLYTVLMNEEDIQRLSEHIKEGWYAHFWNEKRHIIAIFSGKMFEFEYDKKESWHEAVQYGLFVGIPLEQLDFVIETNR